MALAATRRPAAALLLLLPILLLLTACGGFAAAQAQQQRLQLSPLTESELVQGLATSLAAATPSAKAFAGDAAAADEEEAEAGGGLGPVLCDTLDCPNFKVGSRVGRAGRAGLSSGWGPSCEGARRTSSRKQLSWLRGAQGLGRLGPWVRRRWSRQLESVIGVRMRWDRVRNRSKYRTQLCDGSILQPQEQSGRLSTPPRRRLPSRPATLRR